MKERKGKKPHITAVLFFPFENYTNLHQKPLQQGFIEHNLDGEECCHLCTLSPVALLHNFQKKLSAAQVLCFPGTEVTGTMNLI